MGSAILSRATVRKAVAALFTPLVQSGLVQVVYDYQVGDLQGQSPVIVVVSGPAKHEKITERSGTETHHVINVHLLVLYATEDGAWTEEMSEDKIDAVEKAVADVLIDNAFTEPWVELTMGDFSEVTAMLVGNVTYRHEAVSTDVHTRGV